jgi:hypothetical protein
MRALLPAAAALALCAAPPAALAQNVPSPAPTPSQHTSDDALGPGGDHPARPGAAWSLEQRETWLQQQIDQRGSAEGRGQLDALRAEQARLMATHGGGLTNSDHIYLARRIDEIAGRLGLGGAPPWGG